MNGHSVDAAIAAIPDFIVLPHNTELEKLWIVHDPEFPKYVDAFDAARARSAAAPEYFIVLSRTPGWWRKAVGEYEPFSTNCVRTFAEAYAAFNSNTDIIAIATGGHFIACKR